MNLPASNIGRLHNGATRRNFLKTVATTSMAAATASLIAPSEASAATTITDADILNFALNLEYLEAEFYAKAYYGVGLAALGVIPAGVATTSISYPATPRVSFFNPFIYGYAAEIANDEIAHVSFLRQALGNAAINEPAINLSSSFDMLAANAGLSNVGFDPFSSEENFLLGAFIFEDVGVTAYHGAAGLLTNKANIPPAAGILSVEAYHASIVRTTLFGLNYGDSSQDLGLAVNQISQLRASLGGGNDQGITNSDGTANIVPADGNSLVFARTTRQVLNIVYGKVGASSGLFFPSGVNGNIKS